MLTKHNKKIRVLIVDDVETFRERFFEVLSTDNRIEVVGLASSADEAVEITIKKRPDIILMDIIMEDDTAGIRASLKINEKLPEVKIIISTVLDDDETVFNSFQTGAVDYLLKNATEDEVRNAVIAAYNDRSPIRPMIAKKIRKEFKKMRNYQESIIYTLGIIRSLTRCELNILLMLCDGKSRKDISYIMCVEMSTVKTHINRILKKFEMKNTSEVVSLLKKMCIIDIIKQGVKGENF